MSWRLKGKDPHWNSGGGVFVEYTIWGNNVNNRALAVTGSAVRGGTGEPTFIVEKNKGGDEWITLKTFDSNNRLENKKKAITFAKKWMRSH